ncbi:hypothetical protein [Aquimarina sp. MMG016]|uniref:hypothetical protein n=1 Tax=Aquimarina sp. MMG016 TaxID=2822690 RepID=UPI001B39CFBC|nr:hypothetical protein [Aquimarina sp. MMG016]MBQ4820751.1 hypothetical protein [Aquimarina sp. MMG016]
MERLVKLLFYAPFIMLVITYAKQSIQAFIGTKYMYDISNALEMDTFGTLILFLFVGFHDTMVVVLLLFKEKLLPKLPTIYLYTWVGIWPIIPRFVLWIGGASFVWSEAIIFFLLSAISYYLLKRRATPLLLNF